MLRLKRPKHHFYQTHFSPQLELSKRVDYLGSETLLYV
jgi:hypothetical protein